MPLIDQTEAYTLIDASVAWTSASDKLRVALLGRNLTDEEYKIGGYYFPGAAVRQFRQQLLRTAAHVQPERELSVRLTQSGRESSMGWYDVPRPIIPDLIAQHGRNQASKPALLDGAAPADLGASSTAATNQVANGLLRSVSRPARVSRC